MGMTPMISPDGATGEIPTTRVAEAVKNGFKIGAKLTSPDGQTGAVPLDRVHDAIKAGFSPYVESESNAHPVAPVPLPGAGQKILGGTFPSPLDPSEEVKLGLKPNQEAMGTPIIPGGMSPTQFAGGLAGGLGGSKLGEYIGEKSKLSPTETMWASRIGGVLGAFAGAGGGAQAESIWGGLKQSFAAKLYNAEGELTAFGKSMVHPTTLPENAIRTFFPPPTEFPAEGTGAPLPSSADFYESKAADLTKRGTQQATLDRQAATAARASARDASKYYSPSGGTSSSPESVGTLPPAAAQIGTQEAAATGPVTTTGPAANIVTGRMAAAKPAPGSLQEAVQQSTPQPGIVAPGSAPPPIKGSFWSYPQPELEKAVLAGDREAAVVYRMRFNTLPKGASYLNDVSESIIKGLYKSSK